MLPIDERARVDDYARRRTARLRQGPPVQLPVIDVDRIDRAAAVLAGADVHGRDAAAANDRGRDAFRAAVTERRWPDVMRAWTTWLEEVAAVRSRLNRISQARGELGLPGIAFVINPPRFLDELGSAMEVLGHMIFTEAEASARNAD